MANAVSGGDDGFVHFGRLTPGSSTAFLDAVIVADAATATRSTTWARVKGLYR